ncbi:MAG: RDD family protein [Reichenbachiella sp.]|uniref:RDD family protein n=1 Tax=Reichenbachiella sp. TaxID=2184521 RepID=UPI003265E803
MQSIEINTTQNVRINYEVAQLGDRILAFIIDFLIILAAFILTSILAAIFSSVGGDMLFFLVAMPIFIFYNLASEIILNGRTIGKRSMSLKVVKTNGKEPKNSDYFLRWVFRMIDIYLSLGSIAIIFIATSKNGQRLGDLISDTTLIRIKPGGHITYNDILRNQEKAQIEVTYQWAKNLSDKEILLIQEVLRRNKKYNNQSHEEILDELVGKVKQKLHLDFQLDVGDKKEFLRTTVRDYIALTR